MLDFAREGALYRATVASLHSTICLLLASGSLLLNASAADDTRLGKLAFTGEQSCSSTSCHGGGTGRNECIVYNRRDRHAISYGILAKGTSLRISEALHITGDPAKDAQCNVCHAPMQGVALERLTKGALADKGVSCEACHGPAENWLRFHTRPDVNYQQIVATGMRDLNDVYGRANTCVACHLNLDESIRKAGHPELYFELDGQTVAEPPHYKDERPSLGARQWLTGQAAALRELSWKLAGKRDDLLIPRWKALLWLLRKTAAGKGELPQSDDFAAVQHSADQLARKAADLLWSKEQLVGMLKEYVGTSSEFADAKADKIELRRRAEVLVPAIDRLWKTYRKETGTEVPAFETALDNANLAARDADDFDPQRFAKEVDHLQAAFAGGK